MIERLLFENETCLVINKIPGESAETPELASINKELLYCVHRLDMPVSGCLLLAKTPQAAAFFGDAFARPAVSGLRGRVEKLYWAIIEKTPAAETLTPKGELVHWIGVNKRTNKAFAFDKRKNLELKEAVLRYRVTGQGEHYLFLEIDLVTGRHHQIRAQLAAVDLHIKGDLKYGARRSEKTGGIRLHAYSLAFPDPMNPGETIKVTAPPPAMDSLWTAFTSADAL